MIRHFSSNLRNFARFTQINYFSRTMSVSAKINVFKTVQEVRDWRRQALLDGKTVGMVPTMGALHDGHLKLVSKSVEENDHTIVSVFVNPSQFAPGEDLDAYPRTIDSDLKALGTVHSGTSSPSIAVFVPTVSEMYPSGIPLERDQQRGAFVTVQGLGEQLEGSIRPQFFRGVATVVTKLLNVATPDRAYFGQKDIQQLTVIKRLVKDLLIGSEIVMVPTVREPSQLAMSSRNTYLTEESREKSAVLYQALAAGEKVFKNGEVSRTAILDAINKKLEPYLGNGDGTFKIDIEYISIADKEGLQEVETVGKEGAILSAAIRVPNKSGTQTRIIDNLILG